MVTPLGSIADSDSDQFLKMWQVEVEPANRLLREHRHINFEIAVVLEGYGQYHTASGIHPMEEGDVFVFSGNEPHCITKIMPGGLKLVNLHFNWQFFSRCCPAADRYPNMFFAHSKAFSNRIRKENAHRLRQLMAQIMEEFRLKPAQLESTVGAFHQCFHVKLWDYITAKRIDQAKRLLRGSEDMTILDIAVSCGFHNTANFNRAFLKFTGITPSSYKTRQELLH